MPSRRSLLAAGGAATAGALAGCTFPNRVDGYVQLKAVQVVRTVEGRRNVADVVSVRLSDPAGADDPELHRLHDEWADRFLRPRYPTVDDALHADLTAAYEAVRYIVGVCSPGWADDDRDVGCYNAGAPRRDFNRAQVHDRVRASRTRDGVRVHGVDGDWAFEDE